MASRRKQFERAVIEAAERILDRRDEVQASISPDGQVDYLRQYQDLHAAFEDLEFWVERLRDEGLQNPSKMNPFGVAGSQDTSQQAALRVYRRDTVRWRILEELAKQRLFGDTPGAMDWELAVALGKSEDTVRSARNELMEAGWLSDIGRRGKTRYGNDAILWDFTLLGWKTYTEVKLKGAT